MSHIRELQDAIRTLHGVESEHVGSAPVKEMRHGEIVWQGVVEVFALVGHPKARHAYAWSEETNDPVQPRRSVSVLHLPPIRLPGDAVKVAMSATASALPLAGDAIRVCGSGAIRITGELAATTR